jgi:hypothetical protein
MTLASIPAKLIDLVSNAESAFVKRELPKTALA